MMKKDIAALLLILCMISVSGCSSKDNGIVVNPDGSSESSSSEAATESYTADGTSDASLADSSLADAEEEDDTAREEVTSADGSYTTAIVFPEGFTYSEYSSDTVCTYDSEDGTTSYTFMVQDMSLDEAESQMYSEVQYTAGANASGEVNIEAEASEKEVEGRTYHWFTYDYSGRKGARIWTEVASGEVLTCSAENYADYTGEIADVSVDQVIEEFFVTAK